jgi:ABC-type Mn2+/Zn2+ transport system ATPase subunit
MTIKIKDINISGIRGIKNTINLPLNEKSVLLYGDNGTGKSSISDSIEWLYTDKISHLSNEEIVLKDALRNSYISKPDVSKISISFNKKLNISKSLYFEREKLVHKLSNSPNSSFSKYLDDSKNENLLLRYQSLRDFIDQTKSDKLRYLSDIIGFSDVTKIKDILKRTFNSIKNEIKNQNFEAQRATQEKTLISKIGAAVSQEKDLFKTINEIILPLKTGITVSSFKDIDSVLNHIKKSSNTKQSTELKSLEDINKMLSTLKSEIPLFTNEYQKYFNEFNKAAKDIKSIIQASLYELLKSGEVVLNKKYHKENSCPLCLQTKNLDELKTDIQKRLEGIEDYLKINEKYDNTKKLVLDISSERLKRIEEVILRNPLINEPSHNNAKQAIEELKVKFSNYQKAAKEEVKSGNKLPNDDTLILKDEDFKIQNTITQEIEAIKISIKDDNTTETFANISAAKDAFLQIKRFEKDKNNLEQQKKSLELIYNEFIKKQKEGLENFISIFSDSINDFYQYMNPEDLFQEIQITTIENPDGDNLKGITIKYKYNGQWESSPQKYFSESHLNCFGISFFLASVKAFNKNNKFFVLDDVISSFDTNHRNKFADLLFNKFSDYQIILLTHESEWFNYISQKARRNNWLINEIKWDKHQGAYVDETLTLKERIEKELAKGSPETAGNLIRQHLEHILKNICSNLEVKVSFKFNDTNEKRMSNELISELISKIKKHASEDLKSKIPTINQVALLSSTLGNQFSHDNPSKPKLGDLKAFWTDVQEFEKIFNCQDSNCKKPQISIENYDKRAKQISCDCGKTKYAWDK